MNEQTRYRSEDGGPVVCADCKFGHYAHPFGEPRACRHPLAAKSRDRIDGFLPTCAFMRGMRAPCGPDGDLFELAPFLLEQKEQRDGKGVLRRIWRAITARVTA
ncbi:hypothetical protein KTE71_30980 [Burkholderia multivorans]|uniref:hypothetical protein n=1 Tax=Burkholderia TaxID=32008 RepID=UPI001C258C13|nr:MULTISPECIES: hypothetical protein [Burkholderia]MBU9391916.1 hypothetical protein [Burkholderia multivorans]MBY4669615.1 hypothetical protein [Burkholderia multivorans]